MGRDQKFNKTHSIRFEISLAFIVTMIGTFVFCLVMNLLFMESFYVQNKREAIIEAYRSIDNAISSGDITSDAFDHEIRHICERYDIEMLVLDGDSKTVKSSTSNAELLAKILWENMISPSGGEYEIENRVVLDVGENYTLQRDEDRYGRQYLEMWGIVGNGNLVLVRSTMESIQDSVTISNTFMIYVAIVAIVAGSIVILYKAQYCSNSSCV